MITVFLTIIIFCLIDVSYKIFDISQYSIVQYTKSKALKLNFGEIRGLRTKIKACDGILRPIRSTL